MWRGTAESFGVDGVLAQKRRAVGVEVMKSTTEHACDVIGSLASFQLGKRIGIMY